METTKQKIIKRVKKDSSIQTIEKIDNIQTIDKYFEEIEKIPNLDICCCGCAS